MGWFLDRGVRTKLMMSFGMVCALMVFVGGLGIYTAAGLKEDEGEIGRNNLPSTVALARASAAMLRAQRDVRTAILVEDPKQVEALLASTQAHVDDATKSMAAYRALPSSPEEDAVLTRFDKTYQVWQDGLKKVAVEAKKNTAEGNVAATELLTGDNAAHV